MLKAAKCVVTKSELFQNEHIEVQENWLDNPAQEKIARFQHGLLLENILNKLSNIGVILEYLVICKGEKYFLEYYWYITHLTIQDGI